MKSMNKILVGALSVLVLAGPAFAQKKEQQKVDSLQRVLANAERTQKRAEEILKQDIKNEKKYQAVKTARENIDRINNELDAAIKAKEEAEQKAKQEAIEAKGWKLYKQKFPEFEQIQGIHEEVKREIARQLGQDPNWNIQSVSAFAGTFEKLGGAVRYYVGEIVITDLKGDEVLVKLGTKDSKEEAKSCASQQVKLVERALECHNNPMLLHETIQAQEAQAKREEAEAKRKAKIEAAKEKMGRYFYNYYFGYTGEKLPEIPRCNNTIELYVVDIPNWTRADVNLYYKCDGKVYCKIFYEKYDKFSWERVNEEDVTGKLVKTLKVEDFMCPNGAYCWYSM